MVYLALSDCGSVVLSAFESASPAWLDKYFRAYRLVWEREPTPAMCSPLPMSPLHSFEPEHHRFTTWKRHVSLKTVILFLRTTVLGRPLDYQFPGPHCRALSVHVPPTRARLFHYPDLG